MIEDNDIEPYGNRILVEVDPRPDRIGRIHVPEVSADRGNSGEIVKAPPGREHWRGKRIVFKQMSGTAVEVDGREALILDPEDILGWVPAPRPTAEDFDDETEIPL